MVTGTYIVNNHPASILFDTGADKSFVSTTFASLFELPVTTLKSPYTVEIANGKLIHARNVIRNCMLKLDNHEFSIDLIPMNLGSFDIVVGMDWLSRNHAEIICSERLIQIPLPSGNVLRIFGDKPCRELKIIFSVILRNNILHSWRML